MSRRQQPHTPSKARTLSKRQRFPELKRQIEIDLEYRLYTSAACNTDGLYGHDEDIDVGPFEKLAFALDEPKE